MSAFPDKTEITGSPVNSVARSWFDAFYDAITGLTGTDGTVATALATIKAPFSAYAAKTTTYAVVEADRGKVIDATSGTFSVTLLAAATAGAGFQVTVRNSGSGTVTIDPNASETINGATTLALAQGEGAVIVCTGSAWVTSGATTAGAGASKYNFCTQISNKTNATGDGTNVYAGNGSTATVVYDPDSKIDGSYNFVTPDTGYYVFSAHVRLTFGSSETKTVLVEIVGSAGGYHESKTNLDKTTVDLTVNSYLSAGQSVYLNIQVSGGTKDCTVALARLVGYKVR